MEFRWIKGDRTRFIVKRVFNVLLILLGTFIIAFANAFFLVPFNIVGGGISGVSIILGEFGWLSVDIWQYILSWGIFVVGSLILGFKFTFNTLLSTIFLPLFLSILVRTSIGLEFVDLLCGQEGVTQLVDGVLSVTDTSGIEAGRYLIIALFGGALVGIGCGLTFVGGGSSGGVDIISFLINKYTSLSVSTSSFIIDALIVVAGLIFDLVIPESFGETSVLFLAGLVGIGTAFMCSFSINMVYTSSLSSYICDVITDKTEEMKKYILEDLDRSITIFKVEGGYSGEEKTMLRIVFSKREYIKVKDAIAKIDPNAFVTYTQTHSVNGEGFNKNVSTKSNSIDEAKEIVNYFKKKIKNKKGQNITEESKDIIDIEINQKEENNE